MTTHAERLRRMADEADRAQDHYDEVVSTHGEALRKIADEADRRCAEKLLGSVCQMVGIGVRTLQSRERTDDTIRRRAVVAWMLHRKLRWSQQRTAAALNVSVRTVKRMTKKR